MNIPDDILVAREKYLKALETSKKAEAALRRAEEEHLRATHAVHQTAAVLEDADQIMQTVAMGWLRSEEPL